MDPNVALRVYPVEPETDESADQPTDEAPQAEVDAQADENTADEPQDDDKK